VKLSEAKRGFVLLPRRWVVERSFAWMTRFLFVERFIGDSSRPLGPCKSLIRVGPVQRTPVKAVCQRGCPLECLYGDFIAWLYRPGIHLLRGRVVISTTSRGASAQNAPRSPSNVDER
jgi:hypothetical protein